MFAVIGLQHFIVEPSFSASSSLSNAIASSSLITKNNSDRLIAQDSNVDSPSLRTYDSLSEEEKALFNKIILFASIFGLVVYVFTSYCLMKIADKLEIPNSWLAWIPIAQIWVMVRAAGKPGWWLILFFIPLVNFVIGLIVFFSIPTSLNKSSLYGLLLFVPILGVFLYFGLLAFT
ncbi:DUF805 domain-containing protein [Pseudanabaena sp. UWO311]|uniref:DUF5684 domain-containing protein n=1 Tax=Pseudanabaena sp. UWO311 TaxID=2487337 RepID=UPI00115AC7C6|nr:DUF5684 domain-containing protein [Pseudanabaena sp. UWO311]TYQ26326.1 DUF805 domain-containing protein [Pseudanabaena sp. UWO311]